MITTFYLANIIGFGTIPITIYQFLSKSKAKFLWINIFSTGLWTLALWLQNSNAYFIGFLGVVSSFLQIIVDRYLTNTLKTIASKTIFLGIILLAVYWGLLAHLHNLPTVLAALAFVILRFAESLREIWLRYLVLISALTWAYIAFCAQTYTLMFSDLFGFSAGVYWLIKHYNISLLKFFPIKQDKL